MLEFKKRGFKAIFTTTMPMYSKSKSTTVSGGIDKVLLVKELKHKFIKLQKENKSYYQHVTNSYLKENMVENYIETHKNFPVLLTVEVFKFINEKKANLDLCNQKVLKIKKR